MKMLTQDRLRQILFYDPETGEFRWIAQHNRMTAGSRAGTVIRANGYRCIHVDGRRYVAHRLAWFYVHGRWPALQIDHINRVPDDNRLCNLREATQAQNNVNQRRRSDNTAGYTGVSFHKEKRKYRAYSFCNGRQIFAGYFDTAEEAAAARFRQTQKIWGEFASVAAL